jgi:hypothetical protein
VAHDSDGYNVGFINDRGKCLHIYKTYIISIRIMSHNCYSKGCRHLPLSFIKPTLYPSESWATTVTVKDVDIYLWRSTSFTVTGVAHDSDRYNVSFINDRGKCLHPLL